MRLFHEKAESWYSAWCWREKNSGGSERPVKEPRAQGDGGEAHTAPVAADRREGEGHGNDGGPARGARGGRARPWLQPTSTRPPHTEPPVGATGELNHQQRTRDNGPRVTVRGVLHPERPSRLPRLFLSLVHLDASPCTNAARRSRVDVWSPTLSEASRTCSRRSTWPAPAPCSRTTSPPNSLETRHPRPAHRRPPGLRTTPHQLLRRPHSFRFPGVEPGSWFLRFGSQVHGLTSLNQGLL